MGILATHLDNIPRDYNMYLLTVPTGFGNTPERIIQDLFVDIAREIGENNLLVKLLGRNAIEELREKFNFDHNNWPSLILTEKHPIDLVNGDQFIKITLEEFYLQEDKLRDFLFILSRLMAENDFKHIIWNERKRKIENATHRYKEMFKVIISLIGLV